MSVKFPSLLPLILLLLLLSHPTFSTTSSFHSTAIKMAKGGDLEGSLKYFRAAVREMPNNHKWVNDLGVTEMRLGHLTKAASRFLTSLHLSPNYSKALSNIQSIQEFLTPSEWLYAYSEWLESDPSHTYLQGVKPRPSQTGQIHTTRNLPVITYSSILDPNNDTAAMFVTGDRPYILTGAMEGWNYTAWTKDNLIRVFGESRVDYYPQGMKEESVHPFFSSLENALNNMEDPTGVYDTVDASDRRTYVQWNVLGREWKMFEEVLGMELPPMFKTDDQWIEECFGGTDSRVDDFFIKTHWRMMLVGQTGAGMFNHKDTLQSTSYQAQISGRKRWHLCPDSQTPNIYGAGQVNMFSPDYESYPKAKELDCYDDVVETGMMIYYPANYWHQTRNLDPFTMSVSGTLVTEGNTPLISKEFARECDTSRKVRIFTPEEKLCDGLRQCKNLWEMKSWREDIANDIDKMIRDREQNRK